MTGWYNRVQKGNYNKFKAFNFRAKHYYTKYTCKIIVINFIQKQMYENN